MDEPRLITDEVVATLGKLVNLDLSADRVVELTPQVQQFMALFAMLDALDLDDVEPTTVFQAEWR